MQGEFGDLQKKKNCGLQSLLVWDLDSTCFYRKVLYVPTAKLGWCQKMTKRCFSNFCRKKFAGFSKKVLDIFGWLELQVVICKNHDSRVQEKLFLYKFEKWHFVLFHFLVDVSNVKTAQSVSRHPHLLRYWGICKVEGFRNFAGHILYLLEFSDCRYIPYFLE